MPALDSDIVSINWTSPQHLLKVVRQSHRNHLNRFRDLPKTTIPMNTTFSHLIRASIKRGLGLTTLLGALFLLQACEKEDPRTGVIYRGGSRSTCFPRELENGLIAFYPFENGSLLDQSGNMNDLINPTGALTTEDRLGNSGCAFEFIMANEEYLVCENPIFLDNLTQISISLWYQSSPLGNPGSLVGVVLRGDSSEHRPDTMSEWALGIYDCRRPVFGYANSAMWHHTGQGPLGNFNSCDELSDFMNSAWHHLVAIYGNGTHQLWLDGVPSIYTPNAFGNCLNPSLMEDISDFYLGKTFGGKVDDLAIYNRALSNSEVAQLFDLLPCCEN